MIFRVSLGILFFAFFLQYLRADLLARGLAGKKSAPASFWNHLVYGKKFVAPAVFAAAIVFIIGYYSSLTYSQYLLWRAGPPTTYFLPPHRTIFYLLGYHFTRFLLYYLVSLIVAISFMFLAAKSNKKSGEKFFDSEEPYLGALAIFLLGNRAWFLGWTWIFYFLALGGLYLLSHLFWGVKNKIAKKRGAIRLPLYWLWLLTAILVMCAAQFSIFNF